MASDEELRAEIEQTIARRQAAALRIAAEAILASAPSFRGQDGETAVRTIAAQTLAMAEAL